MLTVPKASMPAIAVVILAVLLVAALENYPESKADKGTLFALMSDAPTWDNQAIKCSSVLVDKDEGYVLTSAHCLGGKVVGEIVPLATFKKRGGDVTEYTMYRAAVAATDKALDLALLKMWGDTSGLKEAALYDAQSLPLGQEVIVSGNPLGIWDTVSFGRVTNTSLRVPIVKGEVILVDAGIIGGNSGGPVYTIDGELLGISTAVFQQANGFFASPITHMGIVTPYWVIQEFLEDNLYDAER